MNSLLSNLHSEFKGLHGSFFDMSTLGREPFFDPFENNFLSNDNSHFDLEYYESPKENKIEPESQQNPNEIFSSPNASRTTQFSGEESPHCDISIDSALLTSEKPAFKLRNSEQRLYFDQSIGNVNEPGNLGLNEELGAFGLQENQESEYFGVNSIKKSSVYSHVIRIENNETKQNQKKNLLNKKKKRAEKSSSNSSLETSIEQKSTSSKAKKTSKTTGELTEMEEEQKKLKQIQSSIHSKHQQFRLLNEEILSDIVLKFYKKPHLNETIEETEIEENQAVEPLKVSPRMKFADSIFKKINIYFIRIPINEIPKNLIDSNPNYTAKQKIAHKKKLMLTDLSKDVTIDALKDLHSKTLGEIFTLKYFFSESKLSQKKDESEESFEKRKKKYLTKKEQKRKDTEKILSDIVQLPIFQEIASVRVNEIYNQITDNKKLKQVILNFIASKHPDPKYLEMFEEIVEERKYTFELKGNESHQDKQ